MPEQITQPGFHFSYENDTLILMYIFLVEVATKEHLTALTGRSRSSLDNRLIQLVKNSYLRRTPYAATTLDKHGNKIIIQKLAYTLGKASKPELEKMLEKTKLGTPSQLKKQLHSHEPGSTVEHALLVSSIHAAYILASERHNIKMTNWLNEDQSLYDSVTVEQEKIPIRPDSMYQLGTYHIALEADIAGSSNPNRFRKKLIGWGNYFAQRRYQTKYQINNLRVAVITKEPEKAQKLAADTFLNIIPFLPRGLGRFFYFTDSEHFNLDNPQAIFDEIFISPKSMKLVTDATIAHMTRQQTPFTVIGKHQDKNLIDTGARFRLSPT